MKISAIILSFVILVQSLDITYNDILNLNELVKHAQYHKKMYGDNFITFLSKHYGKLKKEHQEKHQEEKKEHEKLPCLFHYQLVPFYKAPFNNLASLLPSTINFIQKNSFFHYQKRYNSPDTLGIFQPPRYI
ncbi:hypothetical protein [Tenacibaculum sp. UWU-22]|uniref:hypothetical protein n=1 Tax=Tenacibaculum sp. UWU-22 TaxID=3234187 RepID=UPI0034DAECF7